MGTSTDPFGKTDYTLVGVPLSVRYDTTDNPLDPSRGVRVIGSVASYAKAFGSSVNLIQSKLQASTYYAIDAQARTVLAGRVGLGSLSGASINEIPDSRRFFAGGGGSVRGFAYRSLSPLGPGDVPIGGRSLFEASLEARFRVTDTIGIVPFVDVGSAFASSYPDFRTNLRYAAGLGLRYFTGFGPLRLDIAVPLDRRKGEAPAALYVSVGQAF
jgi:translocation and assembly module TamA